MGQVTIFKQLNGGDFHAENLDEFIARLAAIRDRIPKSRRDAATIYVWCGGDHAFTYAEILYADAEARAD